MLARIDDRNIPRLYAITLLLATAYGIAVSLIALHLDAHGFAKDTIGTLAVFFAAGIVALAIPAGWLVRRYSAKWVLVFALATYAVTVTVFPLLRSYPVLAAVRVADGASSACIWVSCETILLERAAKDQKAYVTSLYAVAVGIGYVVGPLLAKLLMLVAPMQAGFFASGALSVLAAVYAAVSLDRDVEIPEAARLQASSGAPAPPRESAWRLLARIKTSCFATFVYGYFQASVVLFLPLFLMEERGIAQARTVLVPAFFAGGMLLVSNVAGRLGDRLGHLRVMRLLAIVGTTMVFGFAHLRSFPLMCAAVFVAGATLASISPVSLALQGVITPPHECARGNALYNALYAIGILVGPLLSSIIFVHFGGAAMLHHLAALWAAFVVFGYLFAKDDPAAAKHRRLALERGVSAAGSR